MYTIFIIKKKLSYNFVSNHPTTHNSVVIIVTILKERKEKK